MNLAFTFYFSLITVYLRAVGGEVGATSSLAPKIGPLGLVSIFHSPLLHFSNFRMYAEILISLMLSIFHNLVAKESW